MCPLHKTNTVAWMMSNIKFTSYVMNGAVINGDKPFDWNAGVLGKTFKSTAFRATDLLLWETDETNPGYFNDASSSPGEGLTRRHAQGALMGMMGGHAVFIKWDKYQQLLADPNRNELWCYPNTPTGR